MSVVDRALALALALAGLGGRLGYQLLTQHSRLLLRLETLEAQIARLAADAATGERPTRGPSSRLRVKRWPAAGEGPQHGRDGAPGRG